MHLAQDAVQETLIRCWRQLPNLRDVATFDGWLYRILVRTAADEASKRRRFRANVKTLFGEPSDNGANDLADRELLERAYTPICLRARERPPDLRTAFLVRAQEGA